MKILLLSYPFYPSTGGIQIMSAVLAKEFARQGHEVKVVTQTPGEETDAFPFEVIRRPSHKRFLALARWCDVYFHNNISLQTVWPLLFVHRPWVVTHQTWLVRADGGYGWQNHLKRYLLRFATNISISQAVADHLPVRSVIIGNSYSDDLFRPMSEVPRDRELVFLGRLVSDKGVDVLLQALGRLRGQGLTPRLTVVGEGPALAGLQQTVKELEIAPQVSFTGARSGEELVRLLNAHQIMVIPSRWREPFGIVALEGIACGCVVVGSADGGLQDAIGPCGLTFPNGDVEALSVVLMSLLSCPEGLAVYRSRAEAHLAHFRAASVASVYQSVFEASRCKTAR